MTHTIHYRLVYNQPQFTHVSGSLVHTSCSTGVNTNVFNHRRSESHLTQQMAGLASRAFSLSRKTSDPCPSPPGTASSVSIGTCLKRRRPDVDNELNSSVHNDSHLIENTVNARSTCSSHPLFSCLTPELPQGLLITEARCACSDTVAATNSSHSPAVCAVQSKSASATIPNLLLDKTVSSSLVLLRTLHSISRLWYTVHDALDPFPIVSPVRVCSVRFISPFVIFLSILCCR